VEISDSFLANAVMIVATKSEGGSVRANDVKRIFVIPSLAFVTGLLPKWLFNAGDLPAIEAEDVEELIPKRLRFRVLTRFARPLSAESEGADANLVPQ
jgi:hypothetical protein